MFAFERWSWQGPPILSFFVTGSHRRVWCRTWELDEITPLNNSAKNVHVMLLTFLVQIDQRP